MGAADIEIMAVLPPGYFAEAAEIVALEPKFRERTGLNNGSGSVIPFQKPD
jgi:hypothetical protein